MHRRLPISLIFLLTLTAVFTLTRIVMAYHEEKPPKKEVLSQVHKKSTPSPSPTAPIIKTPTPTPKFISVILPTSPIIPSPNITPLPTPTPTTTPPTTNTDASYLIGEVNRYRASQGLAFVQSSNDTCSFAETRAQEISSSFSHDGFNNRVNSKTLPYPSWSNVTENIAQTSNLQNVVPMWINSAGHAANMRQDTPFVCIKQNGSYFAYEGMKP
jgi:uncharacterized protein YkwD